MNDTIYNALPNALITLDAAGCVTWHNVRAQEFLTTHDAIGKSLMPLIKHSDLAAKLPPILEQGMAGGFRFCSQEEVYRVQYSALNDGQFLLNITSHTYVHHLEQMRTDFVGNVSHEMRTPLTVLLGYLENFANTPDLPAKWIRGLGLMTEQTHRLNNIVNDLLMLSRLENDENIAPIKVDIPKVLMQVCDEAQSNSNGLHVIDLHLDTDKSVLGLEVYLHSAISNLVLNAVKYTPKGGEINIIWEETTHGACLSIKDDGIGIASQHLSRLTERFYRVDSGRSRATGGTGLGLAIVKHVLLKHDATLAIKSAEHKGSTFSVSFPESRLV